MWDCGVPSTTSVKLPAADPKEHAEIALLVRGLDFEGGNVLDVLELSLGQALIFPIFTSQATQDESCFIISAHFDEPARRFRHKPDDAEETDERDDLKGNGKSPDKW